MQKLFRSYQEIQKKFDLLSRELTNSRKSNQQIREINEDLKLQIKQKNMQLNNFLQKINENFSKKLREENQREELSEFNLKSPYENALVNRGSKPFPFPLDQNNSTCTQNTNFVYSEQSVFSGIQQPSANVMNTFKVSGKKPSLQGISLNGTFVSNREDVKENFVQKNSESGEIQFDDYNMNSLVQHKTKESGEIKGHNFSFRNTNQFAVKFRGEEHKVDFPGKLKKRKVNILKPQRDSKTQKKQ